MKETIKVVGNRICITCVHDGIECYCIDLTFSDVDTAVGYDVGFKHNEFYAYRPYHTSNGRFVDNSIIKFDDGFCVHFVDLNTHLSSLTFDD
jgi:hypothetical protein